MSTLSILCLFAIAKPKLVPSDLNVLKGRGWTGELTYLDYRSNKKTTILSDLVVTQNGSKKTEWIFEFIYPDEPKANRKSTLTLEKDGSVLDGAEVVERLATKDVLKVVTEINGKDDNRNARFRHTYFISLTQFSIKKEVRFDGEQEFFERNTYTWNRDKPGGLVSENVR